MNDFFKKAERYMELHEEMESLRIEKEKIDIELKEGISEIFKNADYKLVRFDLAERKNEDYGVEYDIINVIYYPVLEFSNGLEKYNIKYYTKTFGGIDFIVEEYELSYNEIDLYIEARAQLSRDIHKDAQIEVYLRNEYLARDVEYTVSLADGTEFTHYRFFELKEELVDIIVDVDKELNYYPRNDFNVCEYIHSEIQPKFIKFFKKHGLGEIVSYKDLKNTYDASFSAGTFELPSGHFLRYKMSYNDETAYSNDQIEVYIKTDVHISIAITTTRGKIAKVDEKDLVIARQKFDFRLAEEMTPSITLRKIFETFNQ